MSGTPAQSGAPSRLTDRNRARRSPGRDTETPQACAGLVEWKRSRLPSTRDTQHEWLQALLVQPAVPVCDARAPD